MLTIQSFLLQSYTPARRAAPGNSGSHTGASTNAQRTQFSNTVSLSLAATRVYRADALIQALSSFILRLPQPGAPAFGESLSAGFGGSGRLSVSVDGDNATLIGSDGNDFLRAYHHATLSGGAGDDTLSAYARSVLNGGDGNDTLSAYDDSTLSGGAGNDKLGAYARSVLNGGDGNDALSAYGDSTLSGGAGNDKMDAYARSVLNGGDGNDRMSAYEDSTLSGGSGHDWMSAGDRSSLDGGDGNDMLTGGANATVAGGAGDDWVTGGANATASGGDGNDLVFGGAGSTVDGGNGDDYMKAAAGGTIIGGRGDDVINMYRTGSDNNTIVFRAGDGNDTIQAGHEARLNVYADAEAKRPDGSFDRNHLHVGVTEGTLGDISSSRLVFEGLNADQARIERMGDNMVISFEGTSDSITLRNVANGGAPTLVFNGGETMKIADYFEVS